MEQCDVKKPERVLPYTLDEYQYASLHDKPTGPKVYVCSPLGAKTPQELYRNMVAAQKYAYYSFYRGVNAVVPQAILPILLDDSDPSARKAGMELGMKLLDGCEAVYVCGPKVSPGMYSEIQMAAKQGKPITVFNSDALEATSTAVRNAGADESLIRMVLDAVYMQSAHELSPENW